jgi:integrase
MSAWSATRTYRRDLPAAAPALATRAAGVEGLRFHDLRHTAATLAVAAGASTRELMVRIPPRLRPCATSM